MHTLEVLLQMRNFLCKVFSGSLLRRDINFKHNVYKNVQYFLIIHIRPKKINPSYTDLVKDSFYVPVRFISLLNVFYTEI